MQHRQRFHVNYSSLPPVPGVKVGRLVVVVEHRDDYSKEPAYLRHVVPDTSRIF